MNALVAESQLSQALGIGTKAVRLRALDNNWATVKRPKQGGSETFYVKDLLPISDRASLARHEAVTGAGLPTLVTDTPIPKRSNEIGKAKYNLVHAFRLAKEQAGWGQKGQAAEHFLMGYNAGVILPQVHSVVGVVQMRTLEALDKKLRSNSDSYLALCDGRGGWKMHGTNKYKKRKLSETAKAVFLQCYLHGARPSVKMAIAMTRMALEKQGMPESANDSTFRRWLKDYERFNAGVICLARDGMKAYIDQYAPYITRDASLLKPGQCLVADGKTLNFNIIHPDTGKPCRMALIVYFDWASRMPVGWQIMPTENQVSILAAFRHAVEGLGRYPDSVYLDNGRAFKSEIFTKTDPDFEELTGLYARVGTAVIFAKPYNGRAKVVERFFKTFQSQFEFMMPSYCGDSISTKPPWMHRNEKFQQAWHAARTQNWVPNIREAAVFIGGYVQWYAHQRHDELKAAPIDIFLPHRGPGVDPLQLNHDFLLRKKVHPRNCRVTLWGIDYESDCLHNLTRKEAIVAMVDTANLERIWCYTQDSIYLGEAYPVQACHPLARLFGDDASLELVMEQNKRQARMAKDTKKALESMGITKDTPDSMNILPFSAKKEKVPVLPASDKPKAKQAAQPEKLSEKEIKRFEAAIEKAEAEMNVLPKIPRPKYWESELQRYEWCFRLVHEHGREVKKDDQIFMASFEALPEFTNYRQRFEDLKLVFDL